MSDLRTPLTDWHEAKGAKMAPFAGYLMPIQYDEGILVEHAHTRKHASIFDICHMGEFLVQGKGVKDALSLSMTHNLSTLAISRCRYGFILNENGGVLDDCIVYYMGEDSFMIVVNAACRQRDFETLQKRLPSRTIKDVSDEMAKIDLQGPESVDVLSKLLNEDVILPYFGFKESKFDNDYLLISRTGYTGELGFELYVPTSKAQKFWEFLLSDTRVKPAGLGARDTLRLEAGLPLYGHELDEVHSPEEAGFGRMLLNEAEYVGKKSLGNIKENLIALTISGRRAARNGDILALPSGNEVGKITSGSFAPSLECVIAFAWVKKEYASEKNFIVKGSRTELNATQTDLPFYKQGTARKKLS